MPVDEQALAAAAAELYALPREDFTAARNSAAKAAGDKALAAAIRALAKPSTAAWAVNLLVRAKPAEIEALLELGQSMREAQEVLSVEDLRRLSAERQRVVSALARQTRELTRQAGTKLSEAAASEVEETLRAAVADPAAGEAVRAGRLTVSLSYAGLGEFPAAGPVKRPEPAATAEVDRRALHEAEQAYAEAGRTRDAARERLAAAVAARTVAEDRVTDVRGRLREAEAEAARIATEVREAEKDEAAATKAAGAAEKQLQRVR